MKVWELLEILQRADPNREVYIQDDRLILVDFADIDDDGDIILR